jgi:hypothetical protein
MAVTDALTKIGWGIVFFGVIVAVGLLVLNNMAVQVVTCDADKSWNSSISLCGNATAYTAATGAETGGGESFGTIWYTMTQLGSSGLAGWIPVVIVILIAGLVFLMFGNKKPY